MPVVKDQNWKTGAVTVLLLFFGAAVTQYVPNPWAKTPELPPPSESAYQPVRMTLEGTLVCLPHKPGATPTKECALGLRTADGTHYAVDFALMSSFPEEHRVGDRMTGNGVMVPIERLSTDHWRTYDVSGIFSITDGFKILK